MLTPDGRVVGQATTRHVPRATNIPSSRGKSETRVIYKLSDSMIQPWINSSRVNIDAGQWIAATGH